MTHGDAFRFIKTLRLNQNAPIKHPTDPPRRPSLRCPLSTSPILKHSPDGEGIYNYDPTEAGLLLNLQVGESASLRDDPQLAQWFTYERKPDTTVSGYAALTYENVQPWEFPVGTKEMRYYLALDGCTYQFGGYLDTTQSNQPGAITEDLFHQIVATIRVMP